MNPGFKPEGYNAVSPYFIVDGASKLIDLLQKLFEATELRRYPTADGKIMHAEVKIYDSVIMLADANENYPANQLVMHVYVADTDKIYNRAIELGCDPVQAPKVQEGDPDRRGTFKDFAGNMWSVGTQVS
jgi:uncharacterized glyoxalase superfamily protein PhnB